MSKEIPIGPQPSLVTTALLTVSIVFPILGTIAVGFRFYASSIKTGKPCLDDWVIAAAQTASWGISINTFVAAGLAGVNWTTLDILPSAVVFLRALWIEGFPLVISLSLVKIGILLFYARILIKPRFRIAVYTYIGILTSWMIACCIAQLLAGNPIDAAWNPVAKNPLRYNYDNYTIAFAGMSIAFDVIVLCFPLPVISKLQMSPKRKLQVIGIFWLGIFCCVSSAVRFYYIYSEISQTTQDTGTDRYSKTATAFVWGTVEPNVSVITACLPCYGPFFSGGTGLRSIMDNWMSFFSLRSQPSGQKGSGDSSRFGQHSGGSFPLKPTGGSRRQWENLDGSNLSYNVDVEAANSTYEEDVNLVKNNPPRRMQIKVDREFTQQETTRQDPNF